MNQYDQWNRRIRTIWYCSSLYVEYKNALRKSKKLPVEKKTEYWEKKHEEFATKMLNNIYELRGWWVKVGQFLSTQENIMPVAYIEKFTKLQDMMPTSTFDKIEAILKKELGNIYEMFEYIDKDPLASASIGQVHRAKLKKHDEGIVYTKPVSKNDYNVIIKIQHEGIDQFLSSDINTLKKVSWAFGLIDKNFYFTDFIDEWQDSASRELNYKYELYHQLLAYNTYKKSGIPLKIPKIYCAYTTSKVLVMEYIKGFKITDSHSIKKYNVDAYELVYKIIDYFAYQIHNDGFFHGDPHPGNILVMVKESSRCGRSGRSSGSTRIGRRQRCGKRGRRGKGDRRRKDKAERRNNKMSDQRSDILDNSFGSSIVGGSGNEKKGGKGTPSSSLSNASMEDFIDSRYNISKMKSGSCKLSNPLYKSFSFDDRPKKTRKEISDHILKEDYDFILSENMSDHRKRIQKSLSKSEECVSYTSTKRGDDFKGGGSDPNKRTSGQTVIMNLLHTPQNLFPEVTEGSPVEATVGSSVELVDRSPVEATVGSSVGMVDRSPVEATVGASDRTPVVVSTGESGKKNLREGRKSHRTYSFVPAIIDWGLIKQLDGVMKLAFCKLVYNVSCMNFLNIIEAFEDMGFCFKEDFTYDPEIYIENLKRFFLKKLEESSTKVSDGVGDKDNSNGGDEIGKNKNMDMLKNIDKKDVLDQNPISDVPKDIIFFMRVASLLHGLCTQMDVKINYLSIFSRRAKEALEKIYKPINECIYTIPIDKTPNSFLEKRLHKFLTNLYEQKKILGCQVAIIHKKKIVVDTCVGVTSTTDKRPITRHSLFNGYSLNKAILTIALIHLISNAVTEQQHSTENVLFDFNNKKKKENSKKEKKRKNNINDQGEEEEDKKNVDIQNKCVSEKISDINKIENDYFAQVKKDVNMEGSDVTTVVVIDTIANNVKSNNPIEDNKNNIKNGDPSVSNSEEGKHTCGEKLYGQHKESGERNDQPVKENILKEIESRQIRNFKKTINDYICNYWDGFICNNKKNIRIKDVLTLKCFIRKPFHDKITLSKLIDYDQMINMIENSKNHQVKCKSKKYGEYLYLIDTYIISELIHNISGLKYNEYIYKYIIKPLNLNDEMFIPIPSNLLKKMQDDLKKKKNSNSVCNDKGKKYTKEKKQSTQKDGSNTLKNKMFNIPNVNYKKVEYNIFMNKYANKKNFSFMEPTTRKRRSISVDVYFSMKKKNYYDVSKNVKNCSDITKNKVFSSGILDPGGGGEPGGTNEMKKAAEGEARGEKTVREGDAREGKAIRKGQAIGGEVVEGDGKDDQEKTTTLKEGEKEDMESRKNEMNILINNESIVTETGDRKFNSNNLLESNLKNRDLFSFKNKLLNHVDNLKVKTKKINDSIKNMYEGNESTFLKNLFMPQKRGDSIGGGGSFACLDHRHVEFSYIYDKRMEHKKSLNYRSGNSFYYNEMGKDMRGENVEKKWNFKNINKITSNFRSTEKNKRTHFLNIHDDKNKRSHSCNNMKTVENDIKNYSYDNDSKISNNNNPSGVVFKYQNDTNELLDYNINFFPNSFLHNFSTYRKMESNELINSQLYNLEEGNKIYKLAFDENIRTLYENVDTKTSGDESANSELKEKYNSYQRKNTKYRKLFRYIKDLRRSIREKEKKIGKANPFPVSSGAGRGGGIAGIGNTGSISGSGGTSAENGGVSGEEAEAEMEREAMRKVMKKEEELMKKLIEYKYSILKKKINNVAKKKNKKNIYTNEYSDEIEMFSDSGSGSSRMGSSLIGSRDVNDRGGGNIDEKIKRLETYLVMNKLYKKSYRGFISEENHTIHKKTDVYWRLAYAKRDLNLVDNVTNNDMNEKIDTLFKPANARSKRNGACDNEMEDNSINKIDEEKGSNDQNRLEMKLKNYLDNFNAKQCNNYISFFELAQAKPYVLDPLIFDSKKILDKFIPINGRFTARALCKILAFTNNKFFFPSYIINKIRKMYARDNSIESLILTGGMSRKWGIGFQLFDCDYSDVINEDFSLHGGEKKRKTTCRRGKKAKKEKEGKWVKMVDKDCFSGSKQKRRIVGYGQSDISGCLAVSFPEIDLSLTILLSDVFKGADAAHLILDYVLRLYGIKPRWKLPVKVSELIKVL
ncbi:atypical protein kinase, ABC-1 family, putative [Plasmodium ovale]|uniref:Atypical protein kinase, ABC-1 family, putative n=1 Tax=Plasmodium ovale TaxID=36330 RepID=A0A1D3TMS2_PLAOA|nr:atypical protein kinase, ABC-1 family, putative [Plasmodium ovale]